MRIEVKYSRSRVERSCGICGVRRGKDPVNTIKVGDLYRMIGSQRRFAEAPWPICKKCDHPWSTLTI